MKESIKGTQGYLIVSDGRMRLTRWWPRQLAEDDLIFRLSVKLPNGDAVAVPAVRLERKQQHVDLSHLLPHQRLLLLRRERGWTQKDLAARTGLSVPDISEMERGHHPVAQRVFTALGVTG